MFFFINGISTFAGYLMQKSFQKRNSCCTFLHVAGGDKGVQDFPMGISP